MHGFTTRQLHADGRTKPLNAHTMPIFLTSTFAFDSPEAGADLFLGRRTGYVYSRMGNPTVEAVERVVADLENGEAAVAFASGMAAIQASLLSVLKAGDHVICGEAIYGPSLHLITKRLADLGVTSTVVDTSDVRAVENSIQEHTRVMFYETPANPTCKITDILAIAELARPTGILTIVDNTFASPYFQRPLNLGADISLHSATKYLNGHGDVIGGVVVSRAELADKIRLYRRDTGGILSPFDAYLLLRGVRTLSLRMQRHHDNAMKLFEFLSGHPKVSRLYYPGDPKFPGHHVAARQMTGFGGCFSVELSGGFEAAKRLLKGLTLCTLAVSLGTVDTLIEHPVSMTHVTTPKEVMDRQGITGGLVRISVGCEDIEDLVADLERALKPA
ncbi:MAG: aminotransferase class I/II-fold pyridoxal phosphate-dependent enzyme [Nitrospira sp.]|nr:aminotransferase class I/II-fold pyridoxal phosphate-dependent enzyme [Nitrospira sp.]